MPSLAQTLQHLSSFARFSAQRGARERDDVQTMRELSQRALPLGRGLEVQWLGTAGYRLTFEGRSVLIDPYLTRISLGAVLRGVPVRADESLHARYIDAAPRSVEAILVGHTHFDHAIDVPALSERLGALAYGSRSLKRLMELYGRGEGAVEVDPSRTYELGPFRVRFVPSLHSKLLLGYKVPYDGELSCEHLDALTPSAYRCGQVYGIHIEVGGTTLYHQGSANLIDELVPSGGVDVFLAGIAGRSFTEDYWPRILRRLKPAVVVANHYDDFFRPLAGDVGFSTNVNLTAFPDEVATVSREIAVAAIEPLGVRGA
jgi:L-ascorbate metabolism protein UlaG (beta-lactamase superfamily)